MRSLLPALLVVVVLASALVAGAAPATASARTLQAGYGVSGVTTASITISVPDVDCDDFGPGSLRADVTTPSGGNAGVSMYVACGSSGEPECGGGTYGGMFYSPFDLECGYSVVVSVNRRDGLAARSTAPNGGPLGSQGIGVPTSLFIGTSWRTDGSASTRMPLPQRFTARINAMTLTAAGATRIQSGNPSQTGYARATPVSPNGLTFTLVS